MDPTEELTHLFSRVDCISYPSAPAHPARQAEESIIRIFLVLRSLR